MIDGSGKCGSGGWISLNEFQTKLESERAELAAQQEELMAALLTSAPAPDSIEKEQVDAAAASLVRKRMRAIFQAHPEIKDECTEKLKLDVQSVVRDYVARYPGSHPQGVCTDAARLRKFLKECAERDRSEGRRPYSTALSLLKFAFDLYLLVVSQELYQLICMVGNAIRVSDLSELDRQNARYLFGILRL